MTPQVLLIEDDPRIREVVERGLGARGFSVLSAADGASGLDLARTLDVDVVLLDLRLPDRRGMELLEEIRAIRPRLPVIVLTALGDLTSKVGGLEAGADDYITKPVAIEELAARIRARLRARDDVAVLRAGPLVVDLAAHRAFLHGREVPLSPRELTLLAAFLRHPGRVLSRVQLLQLVWNLEFDPGSNVVDVHVAALRRKIGAAFIETVRGAGYRFVVPPSGPAEPPS
ncbi:MAG: response regulator transcription factor [Armatimonadota bacterium]|nr:response regulator transcription factor [Armatimonadota bacterium]MDR7448231.1 response regulator transcription factor [Armatimonadota bacterium]MDR7458838.1 response regulator transcription factor [Armatimonadota bacterium]MDR7479124.1 response regulator transcription factor [Armatimonadota bacterium]MDR7487664.1 response regulator transcription factor [Armatimonadota bacterium]